MNKKTALTIGSIVIIWILAIMSVCFIFQKNELGYLKKASYSESVQKEVSPNGKKIQQDIKITKNNFSKLKIYFDKTNVTEKQTIQLELREKESEKVIVQKKVHDYDIVGNQSYLLTFPKQSNSKGETYILSLTYKKNSDKNILPLVFEGGELDLDGKEHSLTMIYETYHYDEGFVLLSISIFAIIFIVTNLILFFTSKKKMKIETKYLILAIFIYSVFLLLMPIFTGHDEYYHWFRAYEVSEGKLVSGIQDKQALSKMPVGVGAAMNEEYQNVNYNSVKESLGIKIDKTVTGNHDMSTVAVYSPVQYIPQATGIKLASLFTNHSVFLAYAGRFMNMIFAIAMIYMAIRIIPIGKKMLFALAFFPIFVEGVTTLSPDGITNVTSILFIAYILRLLKNKAVNNRDVTILTILGIVIGLSKIVYIPLVFLVLLLPKKYFKNSKSYWTSILIILLSSVMANLIWLFISSRYLALYRNGASSVQTHYVLTHLIEYAQIFLGTIGENFDYYFMTLVGRDLAWGGLVVIYPIIIYTIFWLFIVGCINEKDNIKDLYTKKNLFVIFLILLCIVGLVFTSLFVQWTSPGVSIISGVQGRYFLPLMPLVGLLLIQCGIKTGNKINYEKVAVTTFGILYFIIFAQMFVAFI